MVSLSAAAVLTGAAPGALADSVGETAASGVVAGADVAGSGGLPAAGAFGLFLYRKNWLTSSSATTAIMIGSMRPGPAGSCWGFLYSAKVTFHSVVAAYWFGRGRKSSRRFRITTGEKYRRARRDRVASFRREGE